MAFGPPKPSLSVNGIDITTPEGQAALLGQMGYGGGQQGVTMNSVPGAGEIGGFQPYQQPGMPSLGEVSLPSWVAQTFQSVLPPELYQLATLQYVGEEQARLRTEQNQTGAEALLRSRIGAVNPLVGQSGQAISSELRQPLVDQYVLNNVMDRQRAMIESQRQTALQRSADTNARRGMGRSGQAATETSHINQAADKATLDMSQDLQTQLAQQGWQRRMQAAAMGNQIGSGQDYRADSMARSTAGLLGSRQFQPADYSGAILNAAFRGQGNGQYGGMGQQRGIGAYGESAPQPGVRYQGGPWNNTGQGQPQNLPSSQPTGGLTGMPGGANIPLTMPNLSGGGGFNEGSDMEKTYSQAPVGGWAAPEPTPESAGYRPWNDNANVNPTMYPQLYAAQQALWRASQGAGTSRSRSVPW
jgi:hypothetical protein